MQLYNLCLTAIPVLLLGVLDQDLPAAVMEQQPGVYKPGLTRDSSEIIKSPGVRAGDEL
jgi:hypothetical protein